MPPPPDPVNEVMSTGTSTGGHLGWADFATIIGVVTAFLTFLGTLLLKGRKSKAKEDEEESEDSVELTQLRSKISQLKTLAEDLDERYTELKKEIRSLEETVDDNSKDSTRNIKKLESEIEDLKRRMDRIIELILKLLSEQ